MTIVEKFLKFKENSDRLGYGVSEKEIEDFYATFYDLLDEYPDGDDYWVEVATPSDSLNYLSVYKHKHPDTHITPDVAKELYQNFISDRLDF